MPPDSWNGRGELDFLLQDDCGRVIPVEVKSDRNIKARMLTKFMERSSAPYGVVLSTRDFSRTDEGGGEKIRHVPLYAAHCLGESCIKVSL